MYEVIGKMTIFYYISISIQHNHKIIYIYINNHLGNVHRWKRIETARSNLYVCNVEYVINSNNDYVNIQSPCNAIQASVTEIIWFFFLDLISFLCFGICVYISFFYHYPVFFSSILMVTYQYHKIIWLDQAMAIFSEFVRVH